jgi:hypothetical protein
LKNADLDDQGARPIPQLCMVPDRKFRHGPPKERGLEKAGAR